MENPNTWKKLDKLVDEAIKEHMSMTIDGVIGASLAKHVADKIRESSLFKWIRNINEGFDCDSDGHKYGTYCRACEAGEILDEY